MVNSISIFGDCYTGSGRGLRGLRVVTLPHGEPSGRWSGWGDPGDWKKTGAPTKIGRSLKSWNEKKYEVVSNQMVVFLQPRVGVLPRTMWICWLLILWRIRMISNWKVGSSIAAVDGFCQGTRPSSGGGLSGDQWPAAIRIQ
jgi:hypothetical protein